MQNKMHAKLCKVKVKLFEFANRHQIQICTLIDKPLSWVLGQLINYMFVAFNQIGKDITLRIFV